MAIDGIDPKDVTAYGPAIVEKEPEQIELLDSEITEASRILVDLQTKYYYRKGSYENLLSLKEEAEDRFAGIGLLVTVDWISSSLSLKPEPPVISIVGRMNPLDRDQKRYEVRKGIADAFYKDTRNKRK